MRELHITAQYRRNERRVRRRSKDMSKLDSVVERLLAGEPLDRRQRPHQLVGNWYPAWECHIELDWLLVWEDDGETITLLRTGTHSDIFGS